MFTINKSAHTKKKSGNLLYAPRIYSKEKNQDIKKKKKKQLKGKKNILKIANEG